MDNIFQDLILSYDRKADARDKNIASDWKKDLRCKLLEILNSEEKSSLIDIGAGTGVHAKYFLDHGLDVTCIDLSPALVRKCIEKGLKSSIANVLDLNSHGQEYDCAFALNSLLHIPTLQLPTAISNISNILKPDGLFFWGQYGGEYREGVYQDDHHDPKRFFSLLNDDQMRDFASRFFTIDNFDTIILEDMSSLYFQSILARKKAEML
jgi:SAM-dependent methyltransferase